MDQEFIWFMVFKELLDVLFNPELVQQDDTERGVLQNDGKDRLQLGGLGSKGNSKGKYEGFGNSPLDKEGNVFCVHMDYFDLKQNGYEFIEFPELFDGCFYR
jgi:hypothetical protein